MAKADTASELQAAAALFGRHCVDVNIAFYQQKKKDPHPLACEEVSHQVKRCWNSLRAKIEATAEEPFQNYAKCLRNHGGDLKKCAKYQQALDEAFGKA